MTTGQFPIRSFFLVISCFLSVNVVQSSFGAVQSGVTSHETSAKIHNEGRAYVIVKLRTARAHRNEIGMSRAAARRQREDIRAVQQRVRNHLQGTSHRIRREFSTVPYIALEIDAAALARLEAAAVDVEKIFEDRLAKPILVESILQIEGDLALQGGLDGTGSVVAIADTGIDKNHPFLAGKVIEEACYALNANGNGGDCPNGQATQVTAGAAVPCTFAPSSCEHGTHVAGIATGSGSNFSGVAPGADLIAIQVFHASTNCGIFEENPCARAYSSDITAALERVYELRNDHQISSVNLSLGAGVSASACDNDFPQLLAVMDNLKAAGIATVIAAGNGSYINGISWPACISTAVSVGAVDESDFVASFSNVSEDLDLFAPGTSIESSVPGGGFDNFSGTSMAAPHVAGTWAVLEQANPAATVDEIQTLLETTGRPVTDHRGSVNVTKPRIRLGGALGFEYPLPIIQSIAPTSVSAWAAGAALTVTGSQFARSSVVLVNGLAAPTTYVSDTELSVNLTSSILATTAASIDVSVFSPPPGGGTSASVALELVQPSLTVNAAVAGPGDAITVTVAGGAGGVFDWITLTTVGSPNTTYSQWTYIGAGVTSFTWTVNAPSTLGSYEFRLFANNGYTRMATSSSVTVQANVPSIASISPTKAVAFGTDFTLTVTGANFIPTSEIRLNGATRATNYVSSTVLTTTVSASDLATSATSINITAFTPQPGGGQSNTIPLVLAHPALSVDSTSVGPGDSVTVNMTNGPGNHFDWLALAGIGDPDTAYLLFVYVASGATTATWTVTMPAIEGDYEFRLFENGGYTRVATSPTVTVGTTPTEPPPDPSSPPTLDVSGVSAAPGDAVTVTLSDGPGNTYDWLALAAVGDPDATYLQWIYVSPGATTATWTVTIPAIEGDLEFRLFENGGYTRIATSPTVTVETTPTDPPPAPTLAVSSVTAAPGDSVTVTLNDGPGNGSDWLALAAVGDANSVYAQWTYIGTGATSFTWTVTVPATPGDYEFRFFENGGFTRIATSATVTVETPPTEPPPNGPSLDLSATAVNGGDSVTVTLSDGPGNSYDWLALAGVGDPDSTYLQWTYVSPGATSATWTVTMPATPGDYEVRLFENSGYTRIATSPTIEVSP